MFIKFLWNFIESAVSTKIFLRFLLSLGNVKNFIFLVFEQSSNNVKNFIFLVFWLCQNLWEGVGECELKFLCSSEA